VPAPDLSSGELEEQITPLEVAPGRKASHSSLEELRSLIKRQSTRRTFRTRAYPSEDLVGWEQRLRGEQVVDGFSERGVLVRSGPLKKGGGDLRVECNAASLRKFLVEDLTDQDV
jgi:hypothetical protein